MLADLLNINNVVVVEKTITNDGMGGITSVSSISTIARCAIWNNSLVKSYISDRYTVKGTHTLVCEYGAYTFTTKSKQIVNGSEVYDINGLPDNVFNSNEMLVVPLEKIE